MKSWGWEAGDGVGGGRGGGTDRIYTDRGKCRLEGNRCREGVPEEIQIGLKQS